MTPKDRGRSHASLHNSYEYYHGKRTAEGLMKIMRGEAKPYQFKRSREPNAGEERVLRVEKEIGK